MKNMGGWAKIDKNTLFPISRDLLFATKTI
jgi:hypothetical protein